MPGILLCDLNALSFIILINSTVEWVLLSSPFGDVDFESERASVNLLQESQGWNSSPG